MSGSALVHLTERSPQDDKCWRLSPRVVQVATAHAQEVMREQRQLDEFNQRYTRNPN